MPQLRTPFLSLRDVADGESLRQPCLSIYTRPVKLSLIEIVYPTEVRPAEVRSAEVRVLEVRPAEVRPVEVRPVEVRPAEVCPEEVRLAEVRSDEVRLGKVRREELRLAKVRREEAGPGSPPTPPPSRQTKGATRHTGLGFGP